MRKSSDDKAIEELRAVAVIGNTKAAEDPERSKA